MPNIVVLGGGIGGVSAVYGLKERLDNTHNITFLVDGTCSFLNDTARLKSVLKKIKS